MARSLTSVVRDQVQADVVELALLAKLEFDSKPGHVNVWTGIGDLHYNGDTYQGIGTLGTISSYTETAELKATNLTLTMSGIPNSQLSLALSEEFQNRRVTVWLAFFDEEVSPGMLNDPIVIFRGRMDTMQSESTGETASLTIACENVLVGLERAPMYRYLAEDHNITGASDPSLGGFTVYDRGFDFVPNLQDIQIFWGRESL